MDPPPPLLTVYMVHPVHGPPQLPLPTPYLSHWGFIIAVPPPSSPQNKQNYCNFLCKFTTAAISAENMRMRKTVLIAGHCYFWSRSHDYCDRRIRYACVGTHQRTEIKELMSVRWSCRQELVALTWARRRHEVVCVLPALDGQKPITFRVLWNSSGHCGRGVVRENGLNLRMLSPALPC
jgi:hypothetical protein